MRLRGVSWNTRESRINNYCKEIQPCQTDDLELVKLFLATRYDLNLFYVSPGVGSNAAAKGGRAVRPARQVDSNLILVTIRHGNPTS